MHQIQPYPLWIGTTGAVRDWRRLYDLGIRAVVHVAYEEPPLALPHDLVHCRFPLIDGDDNAPETIRLAIITLTRLLDEKFACLVCCQAGMSRSPAVAAAALARHTRQSFDALIALIAEQHSCAVHPGLAAQIRDLRDTIS